MAELDDLELPSPGNGVWDGREAMLSPAKSVSPTRLHPGPRHFFTNGCTSEFKAGLEGSLKGPASIRARSTGASSPSKSLMPPSAPPLPRVMKFESWWCEQDKRRYMHVEYDTLQKQFRVQVVGDVAMEVDVCNREGDPLEHWDLHIGAVLDILRRPVILKKATCDTLLWLDYQANKLMKEKLRLETELSKFSSCPSRRRRTCRRTRRTTSGARTRTSASGARWRCAASSVRSPT